MTSSSRVLAVATGNAHKLQEFGEILGPAGFEVRSIRAWLPLVPEPDETEPDFPGNSALKARFALDSLRTAALDPATLPFAVVADDSGLAVDLLNGEPGVFSARFAERAGHGSGDAANRTELVRRLRLLGLDDAGGGGSGDDGGGGASLRRARQGSVRGDPDDLLGSAFRRERGLFPQ